MNPLPVYDVPQRPASWDGAVETWPWAQLAPLPLFVLADGSAPAQQQTAVRLCYDAVALHVRFDCADTYIWGTYTERGDPLYDEEVVEVFLAPGADAPSTYAEFEISPNGVLFDAMIDNSAGQRAMLGVDSGWNPAVQWQAGRTAGSDHWWATLNIPWHTLVPGDLPQCWRANFYRIDRPRDAEPEFSCWSPTHTTPADFHVPARFGVLYLELPQ